MATSRVEQTPAPNGQAPRPTDRGQIGWIVAGSLAIGLVAALLLPFAPFIPAGESAVTGAVLCGFALGWAMLAVLSARFTDQPQRWAAVPALFMGLGGLLLITFGSSAHRVLDWVWPPALLALAIWMFVRVRRELRSRTGRWLLYPVIGLLALAAIGGGHPTGGGARRRRRHGADRLHRLHPHASSQDLLLRGRDVQRPASRLCPRLDLAPDRFGSLLRSPRRERSSAEVRG